ncbi:hypothetical protein WA1_36075 [Scytonema hofmannii PCC 7110]|uniref:Uncharacterized protein n=1 Tax=Scytonema hofmannii PCC 7110 TaxID=128403 RepID=A0A139X1L6_9CYAN|nr:hypothetical protein [Scytonema hofmannii]KYC38601.1 hypothetical protein WA1_36075 [Scytonema hofmannii PCC 7110]
MKKYSLELQASLHQQIPTSLVDLYQLPLEEFLQQEQAAEWLQKWWERSQRRWHIDDPVIANFCDGVLLVPMLITLQQHQKQTDKMTDWFSKWNLPVQKVLQEILLCLGWVRMNSGTLILTETGGFLVERALMMGVTASYGPMLARMEQLLFGDAGAVLLHDKDGHESHLERTLNVVASTFQHKRYFSDLDEIIVSIFNRHPIEKQPKYIVNIGCGDLNLTGYV